MPKTVAARPATVVTSAMNERCGTGQVRLKSWPRVIGAPPVCQAAVDDFFTTAPFAFFLHLASSPEPCIEVEFSA